MPIARVYGSGKDETVCGYTWMLTSEHPCDTAVLYLIVRTGVPLQESICDKFTKHKHMGGWHQLNEADRFY